MPLKVTPLPIPLEQAPSEAEAPPPQLEFAAPVANSNPLPVPQVFQRTEKWCWAACLQMVLNYLGQGAQQCDVVDKAFGQSICCGAPDDPECNNSLGMWDIATAYTSCQLSASLVTSAVQWSYLDFEIKAGRPVQVGFDWTGGGGHVAMVCGTGMAGTVPFVVVNDPKFGRGSVYYANLLSAYNLGGSWQWTWVSIA
jgi:hypothetical protein